MSLKIPFPIYRKIQEKINASFEEVRENSRNVGGSIGFRPEFTFTVTGFITQVQMERHNSFYGDHVSNSGQVDIDMHVSNIEIVDVTHNGKELAKKLKISQKETPEVF